MCGCKILGCVVTPQPLYPCVYSERDESITEERGNDIQARSKLDTWSKKSNIKCCAENSEGRECSLVYHYGTLSSVLQ